LSESLKKIPKTYRELKEERGYKGGPLAEVEIEPTATLEPEAVVEVEAEPVAEPEAEVEAEPVAEPEAEPEAELEAEPAVKAKAKPAAKARAKPKARAKAKPKAKAKAKTEPETEAEAEPVAEPEAEPVAEVEAEPVAEPVTATMELTVDELLSAYEEDGAAADAKFANTILNITGAVERIEIKDFLDIYYITLTSTKTKLLQGVRCSFAKTHGEELSQLTVGQTVVVQGKYDGSLIDISMRDCVLV